MIIKPLYESVDDINRFLYMNQFNKHYENLYIDNWFDDFKADKNNWCQIGFSFYSNDNKLVGFIKIKIDRPTNILSVNIFAIIDKKFTVPIFRNVEKYLKLRFNDNVPKLKFGTLVDSDAHKIWEKLCVKHNGIVSCILTNEAIDMDGKFRDIIKFEIHNPKFKK